MSSNQTTSIPPLNTQMLASAIRSAANQGRKLRRESLIALNARSREYPSIDYAAITQNKVNEILDTLLNSIVEKVSRGKTRVVVLKTDIYNWQGPLDCGEFEIDPEKLGEVARGVYKALADAGFKLHGIARFMEFDEYLDSQISKDYTHRFYPIFFGGHFKILEEIELFIDLPQQ